VPTRRAGSLATAIRWVFTLRVSKPSKTTVEPVQSPCPGGRGQRSAVGQWLVSFEVLPNAPDRDGERGPSFRGCPLPGWYLVCPGFRFDVAVPGFDEAGDEERRVDGGIGVVRDAVGLR
jgi:hypothetical protein